MIPKQAIEKAISGGWKPPLFRDAENLQWRISEEVAGVEFWVDEDEVYTVMFAEIALDPSFWQALGKALGWPEKYEWAQTDDFGDCIELSEISWIYQADRFYHLILTGGDTEKFWAELLK
jgi:hypothetical protein